MSHSIPTLRALPHIVLGHQVRYNWSAPRLIEANIAEGTGRLSPTGAVMVDTGIYTGRSPQDKYFVRESSSQDKLWWGEINQPIEELVFDELFELVQGEYLSKTDTPTYVFEGFAGADPKYQLKVRIIAKKAWQAHFVHNMFIRATPEQLVDFEPDFTIINASDVHNPKFKEHGMNSDVFVSFHLGRGLALIGGTEYGGEMKKGIFSVLNYKLPLEGVLSMHCSCNVDPTTGDSALFFGLSGTGKTTLSTDEMRPLVGDDEHGWSHDGVFNFEGGCYAKVINLSAEDEPDIFNAIRFGAQLENVVFDESAHEVDYSDTSKTQNTRVSYPIHYIPNALAAQGQASMAGHPKYAIFLTCDAFGVLPPVSLLSPEQAMYHFISGYTAKVAGTERGVVEPQATFSPCFGGPFLPLHPLRYAELLKQKINDHNVKVYLVNTGWSGSTAASGAKRIALKGTRAMVHAILKGEVDHLEMKTDPIFGVRYPEQIEGVEGLTLDPVAAWPSEKEYHAQAKLLATRFQENFVQYGTEVESLINEGPKV